MACGVYFGFVLFYDYYILIMAINTL